LSLEHDSGKYDSFIVRNYSLPALVLTYGAMLCPTLINHRKPFLCFSRPPLLYFLLPRHLFMLSLICKDKFGSEKRIINEGENRQEVRYNRRSGILIDTRPLGHVRSPLRHTAWRCLFQRSSFASMLVLPACPVVVVVAFAVAACFSHALKGILLLPDCQAQTSS
jgi:hypothetical protein